MTSITSWTHLSLTYPKLLLNAQIRGCKTWNYELSQRHRASLRRYDDSESGTRAGLEKDHLRVASFKSSCFSAHRQYLRLPPVSDPAPSKKNWFRRARLEALGYHPCAGDRSAFRRTSGLRPKVSSNFGLQNVLTMNPCPTRQTWT